VFVSADKIDVPDRCGDFCPRWCDQQNGEAPAFDQGDVCCRCPIFNCQETDGTDDGFGKFRLVEPEDFNADIALAYKDWWAVDKKK